MSESKLLRPDYIFETSWEVCNKVGGIYTVVSTKAPIIQKEYGNNFILLGPDVWKETSENPEFTEDRSLFRAWRQQAESEGMRIRIGRWNINSRPVAILVDFTQYFPQKDKILGEYWESYKLDSITGSWDYVEPALFGYAAGKVIESFYDFYLTAQDRIVALFHEWMTGSGALFLNKHVPQIGTVFTTHATVVGRCIAGNNLPLYGGFDDYVAENIASRFHVTAKNSLETLSAREADIFTTVSAITARECDKFLYRDPDVITPNGFDESLINERPILNAARKKARAKLLEVASAVTGCKLPDNTLLLLNSGRYEFRNKGIDLYLDALANLLENNPLRDVVAFITVPAHHSGPVNGLAEKIERKQFDQACDNPFLTHGLFEPDYDPILRRIHENGFTNRPDSKVKVIFVPSYLTGHDGIFNISYYDLLPGFDMSLFPSYYEPWGYTPLESIVFGVPTITTTLAGFGLWASDFKKPEAVRVISRTDDNNLDVVNEMVRAILEMDKVNPTEWEKRSISAIELAKNALWNHLISGYRQAFHGALLKVESRSELFRDKRQTAMLEAVNGKKTGQPEWRKVLIRHSFPPALQGLLNLSRNLYWCWNSEAIDLFKNIDPKLWDSLEHNPISLVESLTFEQLKALEENPDFMQKLQGVMEKFEAYLALTSQKRSPKVAYFSMEFGLHESVQIYSGGLGVLAGDYMKEASDSNADLTGVGLLYRYGYFRQALSPYGEQVPQYFPQRFNHMPLKPVLLDDGSWLTISVALPGRNLFAKVWKIDVGRVPLYLLDADIEQNSEADRTVTHQLYGGDLENRFKQELLLGVGGIRLLEALGIKPEVYHCNEGHAAFIGIERLRGYVQESRFSFAQATELVRSSTLFTTHTPVPAGHDAFPEEMLRTYIPHYADRLNISWNSFMNLGRYIENKPDEKFSMSVLATRLSQEVNGVSRIHGRVSRQMFKGMYPGFYESEIHIGYVTNGVHLPTWANKRWKKLYENEIGQDYLSKQNDPQMWKRIHQVPDERIWQVRQELRADLVSYIKQKLTDSMGSSHENPKQVIQIVESLDSKVLTLGFARRFATYKRAHLMFTNLERLAQILNHPKYPVQLLFAGKAHPADKAGADLIKRIVEVSRMPQFVSKILFLENYNMSMARKLVQGVDVWLNTPTRPLEASGTSGEKAIMNGVVNFSVLDGWWAEGFREEAGWALKEERTYDNQDFQDQLDAETIYNILEDEIIPTYYNRDEEGVPHQWIRYVKNTISEIVPHFTMRRQLDDYQSQYYLKLATRYQLLQDNDFEAMRLLASWKYKMSRNWDSIQVIDVKVSDSATQALHLGDNFEAEVVLDLGDIAAEDIMVEMVAGQKVNDILTTPQAIRPLKFDHADGNHSVFTLSFPTSLAGVFDYAFRITPTHALLPHRMDFTLVKWA